MLSVSDGFKNSISQLDVYSDGKIDIINSNGTLSYDRDSISKFEIFGTAFSNDKVLGNLAQHSLTLEIFGDLTKNIPLSLENRIQARIGVLVGGVYEYVQFQDFLVTNVSYSDTTNVTMITATDNILKLNVEFIDTNTYPMTLKAYATSVLTACGLSLQNTTFLNDSFVIDSKPFNNGTLAKDIIAKVAELALCFVQVNKTNNKIEFLDAFSPFTFGYTHGGLQGYTYDQLQAFTYDELQFISYQGLNSFTHQELNSYTHYDLAHFFGQSDEDITKDEYWSLKLSDYPYGRFGYNTVVLKTSEVEGENVARQEDGMVASDGNIPLTIIDNDFINTEAKRQSVIGTIYEHILGYKYYPYTLEYRGFPYLELGDIVVITKIDDTPIYSPIYEMIIRYDGGLYGKLQAEALSLTQTKYLNTKTLSQRVKTAEIKVDKVEGEVTIMAGDYYDGKLQGTYYNFDGDAFTITNADSEVVFSADSLGNLTLIGDIKGVKDGVIRTELTENSLKFFEDDGVTSFSMYSNNGMYLTTSTLMNGTEDYSAISMYSNNYPYMPAYVSMTASEAFEEGTNIMNSCTVQVGGNLSTRVYSAIMSGTNNQGLNSAIRAQSDGAIWLYSSNTSYYIYIGGSYKLITVDGSGFLKAV